MDPTDAFFTHTIVGAPFSVRIGERARKAPVSVPGIEIDMRSGQHRLADAWHNWWVLSHAADRPGLPRRRPGAVRRWLERHALWVALLGLLSLGASLGLWAALAQGWWR